MGRKLSIHHHVTRFNNVYWLNFKQITDHIFSSLDLYHTYQLINQITLQHSSTMIHSFRNQILLNCSLNYTSKCWPHLNFAGHYIVMKTAPYKGLFTRNITVPVTVSQSLTLCQW